jgi:hypothetical protein
VFTRQGVLQIHQPERHRKQHERDEDDHVRFSPRCPLNPLRVMHQDRTFHFRFNSLGGHLWAGDYHIAVHSLKVLN